MAILPANIYETTNIKENGQYNVTRYSLANVDVSFNGDSLDITPTTEAQSFTPSGITGYDRVNVSEVTSDIDENIQPENIKRGITILGVEGTSKGLGFVQDRYTIDPITGVLSSPTTIPSSVTNNIIEISPYNLYNKYEKCTNLTSVYFPNLKTIDERGMGYCFYDCSNLAQIDFSNLETVGNYGFYYGFRGTSLNIVSFPKLTQVGTYSFYYAFQNCYDLISVDFSALTVISGSDVFYNCFSGCNSLTDINFNNLTQVIGSSSSTTAPLYRTFYNNVSLIEVKFPSLEQISGNHAFSCTFEGCASLELLKFPSLTYGQQSNNFYQMLKGCNGVTVIFPPELESIIGNWASVTSGFNGTNTRVLFTNLVTLSISSIPSEYTIYVNGIDITGLSEFDFIQGDNEITVKTSHSIGRYTLNVTEYDTTFTLDTSQLNLKSVEIVCDLPSATFVIKAYDTLDVNEIYDLELDENNCVYLDYDDSVAKFGINIYSYSNSPNWYIPDYLQCGAGILYPDLIPCNAITLTPNDLLNVSTIVGDSSYFLIDSTNNQLLIHPTVTTAAGCSLGIDITTLAPEGFSGNYIVKTSGRVSSELNYDFGYIASCTQQISPTYQNVKNNVIPSGATGQYLFRQSGENLEPTFVDSGYIDSTYNIITVGWIQDSQVKGTNTFYVDPIHLYFFSN